MKLGKSVVRQSARAAVLLTVDCQPGAVDRARRPSPKRYGRLWLDAIARSNPIQIFGQSRGRAAGRWSKEPFTQF